MRHISFSNSGVDGVVREEIGIDQIDRTTIYQRLPDEPAYRVFYFARCLTQTVSIRGLGVDWPPVTTLPLDISALYQVWQELPPDVMRAWNDALDIARSSPVADELKPDDEIEKNV